MNCVLALHDNIRLAASDEVDLSQQILTKKIANLGICRLMHIKSINLVEAVKTLK